MMLLHQTIECNDVGVGVPKGTEMVAFGKAKFCYKLLKLTKPYLPHLAKPYLPHLTEPYPLASGIHLT